MKEDVSPEYHKTLGYGDDRQCWIVQAKSYGGSIGVRENFLRKCDDPEHPQAKERDAR